jgi:homoaconitate hydratase
MISCANGNRATVDWRILRLHLLSPSLNQRSSQLSLVLLRVLLPKKTHPLGRIFQRQSLERFSDGVDTDAIIPAVFMGCSPADMVKYGGRADMTEDEFLGSKCFAFVKPTFVEKVKQGAKIVVAENGFGCGSSREEAARSLVQSGVQACIAKSFAFIYKRNQPNFSLLGAVVKDDEFYTLVKEDSTLTIDVPTRTVTVHLPDGATSSFPFSLSTMEERFIMAGGVEKLYKNYRKSLFRALLQGPKAPALAKAGDGCMPEVQAW